MKVSSASGLDESLPFGNKPKAAKKLAEDQQTLIDHLNDGWTLFRTTSTFLWFVRKEAERPFGSITKTVVKITANALLSMRLIVEASLASDHTEARFKLK